MVTAYRENKKIFAVSGILFNHESPRRPESFVTRKITASLSKIKKGELDSFTLGNLDAKRDWGFAGDYMEAAWLSLQAAKPDDYVIASGEAHTVREFVQAAAQDLDLELHFEGSGIDEVARNKAGEVKVSVDPALYRPEGETVICGNSTKARDVLGWQPRISFEQLVAMMVSADSTR
jgi:GDPmannose 4,6-dehydratase